MATERVPLIIDSNGKVQSLPASDMMRGYLPAFGHEVLTALDVPSRIFLDQGITLVAGTLHVTYFTCYRSFAASSVSFLVTAAHSLTTSTNLFRIGVYDLQAGNVNLNSLLASTANDTTLLDSTGSKTKALSGTVNFVRGTRYAVGVLATVTLAWATSPILRGMSADSNIYALTPAMCKTLSGQSDIPSGSTTLSTNAPSVIYYKFT